MELTLQKIEQDIDVIISNWLREDPLKFADAFVIGCSTSEVTGKEIGTAGSRDVAATIFEALSKLATRKQLHLAFQCCEHLNRALVVERDTMLELELKEVTAVPIPEAGGTMAAYAYQHMNNKALLFIESNF